MTGPASPSTEGPTFAPPQLPPGWIAQWDSSSRKYYYVQLATGVSQWEIPTEAAKTGGTPAQHDDNPYGAPPPPPEIITHPDGSQTVRHSDGRMEPIMADGSRGMADGPSGDRGIGSMAMNALLGGKQGGGGGGGNSALGSLANQFLSGGGSSGKNSSGLGGKLVGQLASNLFSPSQKPEAPQNYHGGQSSGASSSHQQGGFAGAVMGGVASMFGGQQGSGNQNYGYSNTGTGGTYSSDSPAPTYNPPTAGSSHGGRATHGTVSQGGGHAYSEKPSYQSGQYGDKPPPPPQNYGRHSQHGSQHSYGGAGGNQPSSHGGGQSHGYTGSHGGGQSHGYTGSHGGGQSHGYTGPHGGQQQYGGGGSGGGGYSSGNHYGGGGGGGGGSYQNQGQGYGGHY